jgi:hypothetical protein
VLIEQPPEPRAAGPDDDVGLEHAAPVQACRRAERARHVADELRPVRDGLPRERTHRALRAQHARLRLVQQEREAARRPAREQARALLRRQPLVRDALSLQRRDRPRLPAVVAAGEPAQAALDQQLLAALGFELAPERAGAPRRGRVVVVRPVAAADQARLAARRRARVAGLELVDQRHLGAGAREPPRERGPEGARPDDHRAAHGAGR